MVKIYSVDLLSEDSGIEKVSLVENPAFGVTFSAFSEHYKTSHFAITNEEKRIIFGPIIIPDVPILRNDSIGAESEYAVQFSRDSIRKYRDKFFRDKNIDKTNMHHAIDIDGLYVVGSIIKGDEGNPRDEFMHLPDGTWFLSYRVENDEIWDKVKQGNFGYSQEIIYDLIDSGKLTSFNNKNNESMAKSKWSRFKAFKSVFETATNKKPVFSKFGTIDTNRGVLAYDGNLTQGTEGVTLMVEGADSVIADGEFILQTDDSRNGLIIQISDGTVVVGEEQAEQAESNDETIDESSSNAPAEALAEQIEMQTEQVEALVERITDIVADIQSDAEELVDSVMSEFKTLRGEFSAFQVNINNYIKSSPETPKPSNSSFNNSSNDDFGGFFKKRK